MRSTESKTKDAHRVRDLERDISKGVVLISAVGPLEQTIVRQDEMGGGWGGQPHRYSNRGAMETT